jgi:hypothetical protein
MFGKQPKMSEGKIRDAIDKAASIFHTVEKLTSNLPGRLFSIGKTIYSLLACIDSITVLLPEDVHDKVEQ